MRVNKLDIVFLAPASYVLAGTFLALLVAFPLGFFAARNTTSNRFVYLRNPNRFEFSSNDFRSRAGFAVRRPVGLGAFAGTLALAVHTATVLGKLLLSQWKTSTKVVEAIRATGAGYSQVLSLAVLPQILPDLISFTLYRLETNIRAASVLGLIGAGGILDEHKLPHFSVSGGSSNRFGADRARDAGRLFELAPARACRLNAVLCYREG